MKGNIIMLKGKNAAGNLVFYTRAGVQLARARAEFVANPRTTRQIAAREKLACISKVAKGLGRALKISFAAEDNALVSARNIFTRLNYQHIQPDGAGYVMDYENLTISKGTLPNIASGEVDNTQPLSLSLPIEDENYNEEFDTHDDKVYFVALNKRLMTCVIGTATRGNSGSKVVVTVPGFWQGDYCECYHFTVGKEGSPFEGMVSDTGYDGENRIV